MASAVEDRRRLAYTSATLLDSAELGETFRGGENQIESIGVLTKTVGMTTYTLRFADRPKFVGDDFYEGRAKFPVVKRTLGELQAPSIQFAQFELILSNLDGFYNNYLEGGADYISFIGARLQIKIGLRDVAASFVTVFDGFVPEEDGFSVDREVITIRANDKFNDLNRKVPLPFINATDFPSAPSESLGKLIPMVLGDWQAGFNVTEDAGSISVSDSGTNYDIGVAAPANFYGGVIGYYVGGGEFVFSIGTYTPDTIAKVYVKRGDSIMQCTFNATPQNTAGYWSAQVTALKKVGGGTIAYAYSTGDVAMIKVKVPYAVGKYSNVIELGQEILYTLGDKSSGDLASSFATLAAKSSPAQSDFTTLKARLWIGKEDETILGAVLGLYEQFRVEMDIDRDGLISVSTLHPEDFPAPGSAAATVYQVEIDETTMQQKADERTFFNQAYLSYGYTPVTGKTQLVTVQKKNQNSIDLSGKRVIKEIDSPNIYVDADADYQLIELVRFYSTGLSYVELTTSWVHLLRDLGEFFAVNYDIGSIVFADTPMMIRDMGVNLETGAVQFRLLNLANFSYTGYSPSNASRFLSGAAASITDAT